MSKSSQTQGPGVCCTAGVQLNRLERVPRCLSRSNPSSSQLSPAAFCLFQAAGLCLESSPPPFLCSFHCLLCWGGGGIARESGWFQGPSEVILSCPPSCLRSLECFYGVFESCRNDYSKMEYFNLVGYCYTTLGVTGTLPDKNKNIFAKSKGSRRARRKEDHSLILACIHFAVRY